MDSGRSWGYSTRTCHEASVRRIYRRGGCHRTVTVVQEEGLLRTASGGFAKEEGDEYSDLDLVIVVPKDVMIDEAMARMQSLMESHTWRLPIQHSEVPYLIVHIIRYRIPFGESKNATACC